EDLGFQREIAVVLLNLGIIYKDQLEYSKALEYFYRALPIMEGLSDKYSIAVILTNIGIVCEEQGDSALLAGDTSSAMTFVNGIPDGKYPAAMEIYLKALSLNEEINDPGAIANTLGNIGVVYDDYGDASSSDSMKKKYYTAALDYYFRAVKIYEELGSKRDIALNYTNIGSSYLKTGNIRDAEKYLLIAIDISTAIGAWAVLSDAENLLSDLYGQIHQTGKAFDHYKKYIAVRDSIFNEENLKKQTRAEMNYEFEKKEAKAKAEAEIKEAKAKAEAKRQRLLIWLIVAVAVAVAVIAGVIYRSLQVSNRQKKIIAQKNKEITDSINYAVRIQQAKLPLKDTILKSLPQSFILFKPKDIVSGDFYFFAESAQYVFIAAADCTGHGIPGAFMSMIGSEKLMIAVQEKHDPGEILAIVNKGIKSSLRQSGSADSTRDGMDIAFCSIEREKNVINYAGANRPLWIIRKDKRELEEIKPVKKAIAGFTEDDQIFETHRIQLNDGDAFYMFSDGYADQNGGEKNKKLMTKTFRQILLEIQNKTMDEQERYLSDYIETWRGIHEQVDDILVVGVKI
ncbi:MAG: tetratricopeptide repeat protein, partial [Bacteroidetes bacterium]|nr:tetratricopeptide repeat protein [Bacteroidota bacterium]